MSYSVNGMGANGMGVVPLPLLIGAAGVAVWEAGKAAWDSWGTQKEITYPKLPAPAAPPIAPDMTREESARVLASWTPKMMMETSYDLQNEYRRGWIDASKPSPPKDPGEELPWLWIALAAGGVGLLLLARR